MSELFEMFSSNQTITLILLLIVLAPKFTKGLVSVCKDLNDKNVKRVTKVFGSSLSDFRLFLVDNGLYSFNRFKTPIDFLEITLGITGAFVFLTYSFGLFLLVAINKELVIALLGLGCFMGFYAAVSVSFAIRAYRRFEARR